MKLSGISINLIFSGLLYLTACNTTPDNIKTYPGNEELKKVPLFGTIDKLTKDNIYSAEFHLRLKDSTVVTSGQIYLKDSIIYGKLESLSIEDFKLFDLRSNAKEGQQITILYNSSNNKIDTLSYAIVREKTFVSPEGYSVQAFRLKDYFSFLNGRLTFFDVMVFATGNHGVIGSYLTKKEKGNVYFLYPAGRIFEDVLDYSEMEEREIL